MNFLGWTVLFALVSCSHVEPYHNEYEEEDLKTLTEGL